MVELSLALMFYLRKSFDHDLRWKISWAEDGICIQVFYINQYSMSSTNSLTMNYSAPCSPNTQATTKLLIFLRCLTLLCFQIGLCFGLQYSSSVVRFPNDKCSVMVHGKTVLFATDKYWVPSLNTRVIWLQVRQGIFSPLNYNITYITFKLRPPVLSHLDQAYHKEGNNYRTWSIGASRKYEY